ncbi:hypothetical protein NDI56_08415 [Haloarcula sp. S1CR25-12]|uniref:MarR family transcriptional regulator n=1 Tax=Haloarcula saliterrae TaxID=2950534 RepID=A0ABU2FBX3_9EURY|nr:hypothetical protein [Haloarcula sp. S1CR25-12]MDS0259413.1 hypothetical protein [Haloarcula sp. S1CR25-12]
MSDTALPDWCCHWSLVALVPLLLAPPVVRFLGFAAADIAVLVVLFEAILALSVVVEDERTVRTGIGVLALFAAGALSVTPGDEFLLTVLSLGVFSLCRVAASGQSWLDSGVGNHGFRAHPETDTSSTPAAEAVRTALAERPRTRRELWDAVDVDADAVDEALETLQDGGIVTKAGSEYRLVESV